MDLQPSDSPQAGTNLPEKKARLELISNITGPNEGGELSTGAAQSQAPEGESTIPEQSNPKPEDKVLYHREAHLSQVVYFVL